MGCRRWCAVAAVLFGGCTWVQLGGGAGMTGSGPLPTGINPSNVGTLHMQWSAPIPSGCCTPYGTQAIADGGGVYVEVPPPPIPGGPIGDHFGTLTKLDAASGRPLWTTSSPDADIEFTPALGPGLVIGLGRCNSNPCVEAYDTRMGNLVWSHAHWSVPFTSSPTVARGRLYISDRNNNVFSVNAADGTEAPVGEHPGSAGQPTTVGGGLVFTGDGSAYDEATGALRWSGMAPGAHPTDGNVVFDFVFGSNTLREWEAQTGTVRWSAVLPCTAPVSLPALSPTVVAVSACGTLLALDRTSGHTLWTYSHNVYSNYQPTIGNGVVFVLENTISTTATTLTALRASDGARLKSVDLSPNQAVGSPVVSGNQVFILGHQVDAYTVSSG